MLAALGQVVGILAVCLVIENIASIERYSLKDRLPGALMQVVGTAGGILLMEPLNRLWEKVDPAIIIPLWQWLKPLGWAGYAIQFLLLILIADFLAYCRHRAEHSKWLWPVHKVHHAPHELHAANDIGHPLQAFFSFAFIAVPMSLLRVDGPNTPVALALTVTFLSYYIHSPIDFHFGPLRRFVVDNRFHRIHHSLEPRHFEKNFGICFSIWDSLFGTAYWPEVDEWPKVGVAGVSPPKTVREFLALPLSGSGRRDSSGTDTPAASPPERLSI